MNGFGRYLQIMYRYFVQYAYKRKKNNDLAWSLHRAAIIEFDTKTVGGSPNNHKQNQ